MVVTQTALDDYNFGVLYTLISDMEKKTAQSRVAKATTGIRKQVTDAFLEKDPKKLLDQLVGKRRATLAKNMTPIDIVNVFYVRPFYSKYNHTFKDRLKYNSSFGKCRQF